MTSEVALMNRSGVALAADSATTVTYWDPETKSRRQRFFKGANKIFNLSMAHPVGLMTYNSANLQGIPWEIIVKAYRDHRGAKARDKLSEYSGDFFSYILENKNLYPANFQADRLHFGVIEAATQSAFAILARAAKQEPDEKKRQKAIDLSFQDFIKQIEDVPLICDSCKKLVEDVTKNEVAKIVDKFKEVGTYELATKHFDLEKLVKVGARAFFTEKLTPLQHSGLVFSGYGNDEYFPQLETYDCFGVVQGTVIYRRIKDECYSVSHDSVSEIVPIAQSEMVNTFMFGASIDVLMQMDACHVEAIDALLERLAEDGRLDLASVTDDEKAEALNQFKRAARDYIWKEHSDPLRRVIGMMPIDELAALAETFVSIESLKERVTKPTESVSGPIDVAVITKGDGFIWIKRKHYFDPDLNLRFVAQKNKEIKG